MDLTRLELFILLILKDNQGITLNELSSKLMVDSSNLDKKLKNLIGLGLVVAYDHLRPQQYYLNMQLYAKWEKN